MKRLLGLTLFLFLALVEGLQAQPATEASIATALPNILMIAAFFLIFYFLFIRPQNKKAKEHQQLILNLQKGDEVVTTGGLLGKITVISDHFFMIMVSEGVEVPVQKQAVVLTVPRGTLKSIA